MATEITGSLRFYWSARQARRKGASAHAADQTARLEGQRQREERPDFAKAFGLYQGGGGGSSTDSVTRQGGEVDHSGQMRGVREERPEEGYAYGEGPSVGGRGYRHVSDERGTA